VLPPNSNPPPTGNLSESAKGKCPECGGEEYQGNEFWPPCPACGGSGRASSVTPSRPKAPKELAGEGLLREQLIEAVRGPMQRRWQATLPDKPPEQVVAAALQVADTAVDAVLPVIEARDKALAKEFRRLTAEASKMMNRRDSDEIDYWEARRDAFRAAAQMLEEKLNG
jgi:hypothetical protein